ncbi:MAG: hypothetical protein AAGE98_01980 [Actinomycetota bacterium]
MIVASPKREPGEDESGRPALGAIAQRCGLVVGEPFVGEKSARFVLGEREVVGSHFDELGPDSQTRQPHTRVDTRADDQQDVFGHQFDEALERLVDPRVVDQVVVVDHQGRRWRGGELVRDPLDQRERVDGRGGDRRPNGALETRVEPGERADDVAPEAGRVTIRSVALQPRAVRALTLPRSEQGRLARAGGGAHQHDADERISRGGIEHVVEPIAGDEFGRERRRGQLRRHQRLRLATSHDRILGPGRRADRRA